MEVLFTRSSLPASRLIRAVTKEPVSHCAIRYDQWVMQSNFLGVSVELYETFSAGCEIVYRVPVSEDPKRLISVLAATEKRPYDFLGMLYLGLRCVIPALPRKNLWHMTGMYICTGWVSDALGQEDDLLTPMRLYEKLKNSSI